MKEVTIYSDGACEGNPGPGGWAAVLVYGAQRKEIAGPAAATTNNRMEMQAAIEGLRALRMPCRVQFYTDSKYLQEGIRSWVKMWKLRGWKTKAKQPVKNEDLWRALDTEAARHEITWHWLKGHAGHVENERCDQLAVQEIARLRKRMSKAELAEALQKFKNGPATGPKEGLL